MISFPNPYRTCTFLLSRTSWPLTPCSTHSPFCTTNICHTKPRGLCHKQWIYQAACLHLCTTTNMCTKLRAHTRPINFNIMPYLAQPRYPLNNQFLAIFFLSATMPGALHYPEFTDMYSPQNGRLSFSLHFMIHTPFHFPSPTCTSLLNPIATLDPYAPLTPLTNFH